MIDVIGSFQGGTISTNSYTSVVKHVHNRTLYTNYGTSSQKSLVMMMFNNRIRE